MKQPDKPLAWWDCGGTRRTAAIAFIAGLVLVCVLVFPDFDEIYRTHSAVQNFLSGLTAGLGLWLAFLELRHSGEANEHRAEQNLLTEKANNYRDEANEHHAEANRLSSENNKLQQGALELQLRIHQLQDDIEKKFTKVRLYARVHLPTDGLRLSVSNLSEFDLWINQVELIVTEAASARPDNRTIGGATLIPHGRAEDDYKLYGAIVSINGNRTDHIDMKFHVKVVVTGVADNPVTIKSPEYHLTIMPGKRNLEVLKY